MYELLVAWLIIELPYCLILYNKDYNCIRIDHHQTFDVLIAGLILTTTMTYSTNVWKVNLLVCLFDDFCIIEIAKKREEISRIEIILVLEMSFQQM